SYDHQWLDGRGPILSSRRQAGLSIVANNRNGETLGRQRQDHAHGDPGGPQLPDRHRRIRTGEVASYGVQTTNEDLSAVSRVSLPASMVISMVAGGSVFFQSRSERILIE